MHRTPTRWHSGCLRTPTTSSPVPVIADVRQNNTMPSLKSEPFSRLIPLLPVDQHAVRVKASNWEEHFSTFSLDAEFAAIFGGAKEIRLTREDIRNRGPDDNSRKCLEIMLWGYPSGMRGNHHLDYLENIATITKHAESNEPWPTYYSALNGIGSLGISTVTKIAYFFGRSFNGQKALILDNRLIGVIARSGWDDFSALRGLTYGNAVMKYGDYLKAIAEAASKIHAEPEQVEFFLFTLGDAFKPKANKAVEATG